MPQAATAAPAEMSEKKDGKHFVTFGQNAHKWGTYISIDWFWNYLSGMAFASWGKYTKSGQAIWTKPVTAASTWVAKDILKVSAQGLPKSVGNVVAFMSVIAGGTLFTIPPLMVLEDKKNRKGIVKWLDEQHYGKEAVANDPRFAEAYEAMDNEPKKGFISGQLSRFASLAPLLLTVMLDKPRNFTQPYFDVVAKSSEKVYNAVGLTKDRLYKNFSPAKREAEWKWLHDNSAIDFGLEPWYAFLHMVTYGAFASMGVDHWLGGGKKTDKEAAPHIMAPSPAAQSEPAPAAAQPSADKPSPKISEITHQMPLVAPAQALTT